MWTRLVALTALAALAGCARPEAEAPMMVFAAASLRDVVQEVATAFERQAGEEPVRVMFNFAASNTLAQQIRAAPRADVFLSADESWIRFLASDVVDGPPRAFLGNRLVAIRHRDSALRLDGPGELAAAPFRRLALADPGAVPAGRYARAYLESTAPGLWAAIADRVVPALDVRAALALVEADPDVVGIVYRSDARSSERVRELFEFAPLAELPIVYWAAVIRGGANPAAGRRFVDFLGGRRALAIARRHGFAAAGG